MYSYDENGSKVQLRMEQENTPQDENLVPQMNPPKKGLDAKAKFAIALIVIVIVGALLWHFQDDIRKLLNGRKSKSVKHRSSSSSAEASFESARSSHSSDAFNF